MRRVGFWTALAGAGVAAGAAAAQPGTGYTVVPAAERLTVGRVFGDAAPEVQLVFAILLISVVAVLAIWAISLPKVGKGDAAGLAGALGRLRIVRSAATPLGFLAASYTLFSGFMGIANVRPAPTMTVMAPGWAEAALAVMLGLLATTVAVVCERHLEARIRRAAA
ncbi:MAG TPA: hypothetical protein VF495_18820 [Phenylobacterium sp.]